MAVVQDMYKTDVFSFAEGSMHVLQPEETLLLVEQGLLLLR